MNKIFKKFTLAVLGLSDLLRSKIRGYVQKIKKEGVNTKEGRKFVQDVASDVVEAKEEAKEKIQENIEKTASGFGLATKSEVEELKEKLKEKE